MRAVQIGDRTYTFAFHSTFYPSDAPQVVGGQKKPHTAQAAVRCSISEGPKFNLDTVVGFRDAYCSTKDEFDLHAGRKLALLRVLKAMGFADTDRAKFWDAFKLSLPKPKPSYATLHRDLKIAKRSLEEMTAAKDSFLQQAADARVLLREDREKRKDVKKMLLEFARQAERAGNIWEYSAEAIRQAAENL